MKEPYNERNKFLLKDLYLYDSTILIIKKKPEI